MSDGGNATQGGGGVNAGGAASTGGGGSSAGGSGGAPPIVGTALDDYQPDGAAMLVSEIGRNLSGNTYNPVTDSHLLILNNEKQIHELNSAFNHVRRIDLGGINAWDLEDIAYLDTVGGEHHYAIVNENGSMWLGVIPDGGETNLSLGGFQRITFAPPPPVSNKGAEGVAYDPATQTLWACSERSPMVIYEMVRPNHNDDVSYLDGFVVTEPFDAQAALGASITDIASCYFDSRTGRLLVLSEESARVLDVGLDGTIHGTLDISGAPQFEGLTLISSGDLVMSSEPNWLRVYAYTQP